MFVNLNKNSYIKLMDYILDIPFNMLMARSVILDHVDGNIFVDDCDNPKSFYIVHPYGMTYLCGDSSNQSFITGLSEYFTGKLYMRKKDEWLQAYPRDWDVVMNRFTGDGIATLHDRLNFKFNVDAVLSYTVNHKECTMIDIKGTYNTARIFTDNVEETAIEQIKNLLEQEFISGSKIRIMPDVHAGMGCTIGTTLTITDKVVPNLVGVDIGCGMLTIPLGNIDIDLKKFDNQVKRSIPSGAGVYHKVAKYEFDRIKDLRCYEKIKTSNLSVMLGTLGGGNHFIELDKDETGNIYLVIHSGSRNLGKQVCDFYQEIAIESYRNGFDEVKSIIEKCKTEGRKRDIDKEVRAWHKNHKLLPPQLCYLTDEDKDDYMYDMKICQEYASYNRWAMANELLKNYFYPMDVRFTNSYKLKIKEKGFKLSTEGFETIHNYIDHEYNIIRKGAISAQKGESVLIPINMRDGAVLATGKGIEDMNYSLPHGAGRLMSRSVAEKNINLDEFKKSMQGIYSSVVGEGTLDEAPQAYRDMETMLDLLDGLIDDVKIIKPIYNFKAIEKKDRRWR